MKYFVGFVGGMVVVIFNLVFFVCGIVTGNAIFGRTFAEVHRNNARSGATYRGDYNSYNRKEN